MRKTIIEPWNKDWALRFSREKEILCNLLKDEIISIHHIGSTARKEIGFAKPIIDILIEARNINKIDSYNQKMIHAGYTPRGENGIPFRRYFVRGTDVRTVHIHIHEIGDKRIITHLSFLKYVQSHPSIGKQYGELKQELAIKYPDNTHDYQQAKQPFLDQLIKDIMEWEKQQ